MTTQTMRMVTGAELRRANARGGARGSAITAVVLGMVTGIIAVVAIAGGAAGDDPIGAATLDSLPIQMSVSVAAFILCLGAVTLTTREFGDGTVLGSLLLVPRRDRLFVARISALAAVAIAVAAMTGATSMVARTLTGIDSEGAAVRSIATLSVGVIALAAATILAASAATLIRRTAASVAIYMSVVLVAPLVLILAPLVAPAWLARPSTFIFEALPGSLFLKAVSVPTTPDGSWTDVTVGLIGICVWAAVIGAVALRRFTKSETVS